MIASKINILCGSGCKDMKYNNNILERIGEFYEGLDVGEWTDFLSRKPNGFDDMEFNEKLQCTYPMMEKIDKLMEDPWQVIKIWSRRTYVKAPISGDHFDTFMEYELDYLTQKEVHKPVKKHFWNRLCK